MASKSARQWRTWFMTVVLALLLAVLLTVSTAGVALLAYGGHYADRIFAGVTVLDVDVGGLTRDQAVERLDQELANTGLPYVSLSTSEQEWTLSTRDLGAQMPLRDVVQQAWLLGRTGSFLDDWSARFHLLWWGYRIVPKLALEPGLTLTSLRQVARQAGHPARRAQLWVAGLQARADESQVGREMDIQATAETIQRELDTALSKGSWAQTPRAVRLLREKTGGMYGFPTEPIRVPIVFHEVVPPLTEVAGARERVERILSAPVTLSFDFPRVDATGGLSYSRRSWAIDQAVLSSWLALRQIETSESLNVQVDLDQSQIAAFVGALADEIACPPRDARFDYDPEANRLSAMLGGQNGYSLDTNAAQAMIAQACLSEDRDLILPVRVIVPRVTLQDLKAILPLQLISEGQTTFVGSSAARLQNIQVATARFHGVVIPPQTTFSFLQHLGLVTLANGYSESWIIYGDRTLLGPGGGVCQVSTTCFRAAYWGGFPIVERHPHSYRVSWYEPPVGFDAAAFSPSVDFRFLNDTDSPILILTQVDEQNAVLSFRFFSKPLERVVKIEGPETSDPVKAGDPVLEEDPSLASGARVQVDWPHDGIDVSLYRIIEQDGKVVAREKLFTRYQPWPARFKVGPESPAP